MSTNGHAARKYVPTPAGTRARITVVKTAICRDCLGEFSWTATNASRPRERCEDCRLTKLRQSNATASRRAKHRRRAQMAGTTDIEHFSNEQIYERDNWICWLCDRETLRYSPPTYHPDQPSLDHVIPLAKGGAHSMDNCRTAHILCNAIKSDSLVEG